MELYGHNKPTFEAAYNMLKKYGECAIDQATGTGKTFITMKLLQTLFAGLETVYVVPTMAIAESIKEYSDWKFDNVVFVTYAGLKNFDKIPTVLILDELHRSGAQKWFQYVTAIKPYVAFTLGLSATPIRYLDGKRNMATELFHKHVVHGPNLYEAVRDGILPEFDYTVVLGDVEKMLIDCTNSNTPPDVRMKLRKLDLSNYDLAERIRRHTHNRHNKAILFFKNIKELVGADNDIKSWFGDVPIYEMHASLGESRNKKNLSMFNTAKRAVLKVVNIANEGLHLDGVTLLIFVRRTSSGNVFMQQLGRIMSAKKPDVKPQVIDLVGNFQNLKSTMLNIRQESKPATTSTKKIESVLLYDKVLVTFDEVALKVFDIYNAVDTEWTSVEDDLLRYYWKVEGKDVVKRLNGRTVQDCQSRARTLGLCTSNRWTHDEDDILREYYKTEKESITFRLPGRTLSSIQSRARKLGLGPKWSREDLIILEQVDIKDVYRLIPDHTKEDIENKLREMGRI